MPDPAFIALLTGAFLVAGMVKGVIGMGLPTVAMGVLGLVMLPTQAAALLVVPSLITNFWQTFSGPCLTLLARRFAIMLVGLTLGTPLGIWLFSELPPAIATGALGAVLAVYGAFGLSGVNPSIKPVYESRLSPWMGFVTGIISGATGVFAIPAVPYLNSLDLGKDELIQALGLMFIVSTVAMAVGLAAIGRFHLAVAGQSLVAVLPALIGMAAGQRVRHRLSPQAFKRGFFIGMLLLGLAMLAHTLF